MRRTKGLVLYPPGDATAFPRKTILRIDGSMHEDAKRVALERVKTEIFDAIFFTASMDCGVSIDIEGYDIVVFRLNERSINADVVMQMCQRVRKLSSNKIIFVCNGRVKDWERWSGYTSEQVDTAPIDACVLEAATKAKVERQLLALNGPEYYHRSRRRLLCGTSAVLFRARSLLTRRSRC